MFKEYENEIEMFMIKEGDVYKFNYEVGNCRVKEMRVQRRNGDIVRMEGGGTEVWDY